jgi:cell division protein FtsI (penicillin-binding protein 3)
MVNNGHQFDTEPQLIGMPVKTETARTLTEMLIRSLEQECLRRWWKVIALPGRLEQEIPTPYGHTMDVTNTSFVGWGPVDDPRFVVYLWLEKPKTSIWASEVAAPIFRQVVEELVVLMDIPPDEVRQQLSSQ